MKVIVMGCGRVGTALATALDTAGHEVVVVDKSSSSFGRLPADFRGRCIEGIGFDRRILEQAGIEDCDAFAAVSSGDNSNIVAARVARETFGLDKVIARIYDAGRAEVYERLGIPTIATVPWATRRFLTYLTGEAGPVVWRDPTGSVVLVAQIAPEAWVGARVDALAGHVGGRVAALTRFGDARVPDPSTLVQADDVLHLSLPTSALDGLEALLAGGPGDD